MGGNSISVIKIPCDFGGPTLWAVTLNGHKGAKFLTKFAAGLAAHALKGAVA